MLGSRDWGAVGVGLEGCGAEACAMPGHKRFSDSSDFSNDSKKGTRHLLQKLRNPPKIEVDEPVTSEFLESFLPPNCKVFRDNNDQNWKMTGPWKGCPARSWKLYGFSGAAKLLIRIAWEAAIRLGTKPNVLLMNWSLICGDHTLANFVEPLFDLRRLYINIYIFIYAYPFLYLHYKYM